MLIGIIRYDLDHHNIRLNISNLAQTDFLAL
jgi:hypothetical protein